MMDEAADSLADLRNLNSLLRLAANGSAANALEIRKAIEFTMEGADTADGPTPMTLDEAARLFLRLHASDEHAPAFALCDLRAEAYDPLFIREKLMVPLRKLAGYPEAILLVTGLRRLVCPPGKRWTKRRRSQYQETLHYIEQLANQHSSPRTRLSLLFL